MSAQTDFVIATRERMRRLFPGCRVRFHRSYAPHFREHIVTADCLVGPPEDEQWLEVDIRESHPEYENAETFLMAQLVEAAAGREMCPVPPSHVPGVDEWFK